MAPLPRPALARAAASAALALVAAVAAACAERSSCVGVYDPGRRRVLFGFGNNTSAIFADWVALAL